MVLLDNESMAASAAPVLFPQSGAPIPDDTMFFSIFPDLCSSKITEVGSFDSISSLQSLHIQILELISTHTSGYIWQHEPFNLTIYITSCSVCSTELPHLHGKLRFGDNLEDEWFVVFLLFFITLTFSNLSIKVWDTDGEFLLIESAFHLPRWLNPEKSTNRVFIRAGDLHIIPNNRISNPSLSDSLSYLMNSSDESRASDSVQSAVKIRISDFPERAIHNMHGSRVRVPASVAQVLKHDPGLISLAVEGFYDRDIDTMKFAAKMEKFLSEGGDRKLVQVWVRMSRAMYAQLVRQNFYAPKCYPIAPPRSNSVSYAEYELGMKITCGFEMMYQQRVMDALEGKGSTWVAFKDSLEKSGYFKGLLSGSKEHTILMDNALAYYNSSHLFSKASEMMSSPVSRIDEVLALPYRFIDFVDQEIPPSDHDSWLYEGEDKLNYALLERQKEIQQYNQKYKNSTKSENVLEDPSHFDVDAQDIVKHMESFMHKISSHEGAEVPESRGNTVSQNNKKQQLMARSRVEAVLRNILEELKILRESQVVDFSADRFMDDLKSALFNTTSDNISNEHDSDEELSSDMDFDDESGDSGDQGESYSEDVDEDDFTQSYSDKLAEEMKATTLKRTFSQPNTHLQKSTEELRGDSAETCGNGRDSDGDDDAPVDVDMNLVKNLIDSFSSQQGLPGPASNLMGLMGLQLPHHPPHHTK